MIAYLDCSTGVSGDKFVGALLDVGTRNGAFTAGHLQALIAPLAPEAKVRFLRARSSGIAGMCIAVEAAAQPHARSWADVRTIIESAHLPAAVAERALAVFRELALAEAAAHGCRPDEVHFHEVGAIDSIVDIVGACAGIEALGIEQLIASPVATGHGTVESAHGTLPVPAPATARLLEGIPTVDGDCEAELTTPTGAALVRVLASEFGPCPAVTPRHVGFGVGTRDLGRPNICTLTIAEAAPGAEVAGETALEVERIAVLETNIDHISGEAAGFAVDQLLAEGALDAWLAPILMKKGRPAYVLSALAPAAEAAHFAERVVTLTGSLGVRATQIERFVADRDVVTVETLYGPVRFKVGGGASRPEADDVARIAREQQTSFGAVVRALEQFAPRER